MLLHCPHCSPLRPQSKQKRPSLSAAPAGGTPWNGTGGKRGGTLRFSPIAHAGTVYGGSHGLLSHQSLVRSQDYSLDSRDFQPNLLRLIWRCLALAQVVVWQACLNELYETVFASH